MIPKFALPEESRLAKAAQPSRTYHLDLKSKRILGMTDGLSAVTQMIYKTLYTQRYAWLIYNGDYGMGLEQYLGENPGYIKADMPQAVEEALLADDRVLEVCDFQAEQTGVDSILVRFTARTTEGDTDITWEVPS